MLIIGCDFHSRFQQIAMVNRETGELIERRPDHSNGEAKKFYAELQKPVGVGMEATGYAQWFERMRAKLGYELWIGDAAAIRAAMVRKQKTDVRDALHILDLLLANRFPRIWIPSPAERDLRQLLRHRHKMVCLRTAVRNQLTCAGHGPGRLSKKEVVGSSGADRTRSPGVRSVGESPTAGTVGHSRPARSFAGGAGSGRSSRSWAAGGGPQLDEATRGGAGHSLDVRADDRAGGALSTQQTSGELPR